MWIMSVTEGGGVEALGFWVLGLGGRVVSHEERVAFLVGGELFSLYVCTLCV